VQVDQRRARELKLTGRFKADVAVAPFMAMTLPPSMIGSQPNCSSDLSRSRMPPASS
jgi:hypothetical protein